MKNIQHSILKFETDEEVTITADAYGNPDNAPLILLHGGGQTRHSWKKTGETLAAKGWYVLTKDARGHGDSTWSKQKNYDIDYLVKDLVFIVKTLKIAPVLIGASMGGITSLAALSRFPDLAKALILVDVSPRLEKKGVDRIFQFMSAKPEGFASLEEVQEVVNAYMPHRKNIASIEGLKKNLRQLPNGNYGWHWDPNILQIWKENASYLDGGSAENMLSDTLASLQIPALLVRGKMSDVVSEEIVREIRSIAPNLQYVDVANAGHMVAGDSNHVFIEALLDFLDGI